MTLKRLVVAFFLLLIPVAAHSQSDAQAVSLTSQASAALTGAVKVNDVSLSGDVTRIAGADTENGNVTLKAAGTLDSRMDLSFTNGQRSEIRNGANGLPQGFWTGLDGEVHRMANHNLMTDASWFFPALTVLSQLSNPHVAATYIGPDTKNGIAVQHVRFSVRRGSTDEDKFLSSLTQTDIYISAISSLPIAICFNTHPDNDAGTDIPVEVDFSDYRVTNGIQIPFRIQKFTNGSLFLDLTIRTAQINTGLADSAFAVN